MSLKLPLITQRMKREGGAFKKRMIYTCYVFQMWVCGHRSSSQHRLVSVSVLPWFGWTVSILLPVPLGLQGLKLASMFVTFVVGLCLGLTMRHTCTNMHTWAEQTQEEVGVEYMNRIIDMINFVKDSMKSTNCNLSICSTSLASHASMELGGNYAIEHLTRRKSHITILIIIIVMVVHKWASVGLMASYDRPLSSLAHLSTDSFWHKMACVCYSAAQNDLCAFLWEKAHLWQCDNRCMQIWDRSGWL